MDAMQVSTMVQAGIDLAGKLVQIAIEYSNAEADKKAELLAQAEKDYSAFLEYMISLDEEVTKNSSAADAAADKLP